jgi:hypothetical protein
MAWALQYAGLATGALVIVDFIALALAQLDDCIFRAGAKAAVAFEAVATGITAG